MFIFTLRPIIFDFDETLVKHEEYPKCPFEDTIEVLDYLHNHLYWTDVITSMKKGGPPTYLDNYISQVYAVH